MRVLVVSSGKTPRTTEILVKGEESLERSARKKMSTSGIRNPKTNGSDNGSDRDYSSRS